MARAKEGSVSWSLVEMVREGGEIGFLYILGRRRGTPRWADDHVVEARKERGGGRRDIGCQEDRKERV